MPVKPQAREITVFVLLLLLLFLQYTVMPCGVHNTLATFQHLVYIVLSVVTSCEAYLDYIAVFSCSWDEHIKQLHLVFGKLRDANFTLDLAKCDFLLSIAHVNHSFFSTFWPLFWGHPHSLFIVYVSLFSSSHMKFTHEVWATPEKSVNILS